MEPQHNPEEMCLVQQMDSLTLSMSPAGPSISNNTREDADDGSSTPSFGKSASNDGGDDENSLMGEHIWNEGSRNDLTDHENIIEMGGHCRRRSFTNNCINGERLTGHTSASPRSERGVMEINEGIEMADGNKQPPHRNELLELNQGEEIENVGANGLLRSVHENSEHDEKSALGGDVAEQHIAPETEEATCTGQAEGNGWADDREDDYISAWDQGTSDRTLSDNGLDEQSDNMPASFNRNPSRRKSYPCEAPVFEGGDSYQHQENTQFSGQEDSISRPTIRRTRLSLDQERRRLDRLPRSQRLRQVEGHPLGGMTLLELEERHLLDLGIGEIAKRLAKKRGGGARQLNTDLLRRSARLLRRAQQEHNARHALEFDQEHISTHSGAHDIFGTSARVASTRKGNRRPASASRERHRMASFSFSLESAEHNDWESSHTSKPGCVDRRMHATEKTPTNVGFYSGGRARCSLKHRRPMSAKPALTCGSGWKPGRRRVHRKDGEETYLDEKRRMDWRETGYSGQGELDVTSIGSNASDLSPNGIVEYTDEEEDPFNVDELERVAASYLRNHQGSFCRPPPEMEDDETCTDDGSVYIYREGDVSDHDNRRQHNNRVSGNICAARRTHGETAKKSYGNYDVHRWQGGHRGNDPVSKRSKYIQARPQRREVSPNGNHKNVLSRGEDGSWHGTIQDQGDKGCGSGGGELRAGATSDSGQAHQGGDVAAGMCRGSKGGSGQQALPFYSSDSRTNDAERGGDRCHAYGASQALPEGYNSKNNEDSNVRFDHFGASSTECYRHTNPPLEKGVPILGAGYSPKVDRGLRGIGCDKGPTGRQGDSSADNNAKVRQVAIRLREMIKERQVSAGRSILQIFRHFDRRRCGYVKAAELRDALADLRLTLSPSDAEDLHSLITLDGGDRFSYAEFSVFVSDPDHSELQTEVCQQAAARLEILGRHSVNLHAAFLPELLCSDALSGKVLRNSRQYHTEANSVRGDKNVSAKTVKEQHRGFGVRKIVSEEEFLAGLRVLGLDIPPSNLERLLVRFDVHGDGCLSVDRFASMVENSPAWTNAISRLNRQAEADEEADACLRAYRMTGRWFAGQMLSEEIVEMARYLGIRVSSDASLLWIAADALEAPLPDGWVMSQGQDGSCFYHNRVTGQSRWDHPMDLHFRRHYLQERFGSSFAALELGLKATETSGEQARSKSDVGTKCSPVKLPPRRIRPDLRDFSSNKALDNLRTRRMNSSGIGRFKIEVLAAANDISEENSSPGCNDTNLTGKNKNIRVGQGYGLSGTSGRSDRRRPASASALRHCLDPGTGDGNNDFGFGVVEMAEELHAQSPLDTNDRERRSIIKPRRPRSAKAALQRVMTDRQVLSKRRGNQREKDAVQENDYRLSSDPSELQDQVFKTDSRINYIETRLKDPLRSWNGFYHPRSRCFSSDRAASLAAAGTNPAHFPENITTISRCVNCMKKGSQDDLMCSYPAASRGRLSKRSWPLATDTGHESMAVASCAESGGSSSNETLVSAVVDVAAFPRSRRREGVTRVDTGSERIRSRSMGAARERKGERERGARKGRSRDIHMRSGLFSPPGIVLI